MQIGFKGQCHEIFDLSYFHDVDTGGKFIASIVDTGVNLPQVTLLDTGGKFATGIKDTSGSGGKVFHWWCTFS
jgi:hypothetical protein